MIGIYKITNKIDNKCYVGKTERKFKERFKEHLRYLRNDKHRLRNGKRDKLQNAWNKYGEDNFTFDILEVVEDVNLLDEKERYWIAYYDSHHNGYNNTDGGEGSNYWKGKNLSEEHKKNISQGLFNSENYYKLSANKGKKCSEETKQKISEASKLMWQNPEHKQKISEKLKGNKNSLGYKHSEETKQKNSEASKLMWQNPEHKQKMSEAHKLMWQNPEYKQKMSEKHKGRNFSEETKRKLSEAKKEYWRKKKLLNELKKQGVIQND